MAAAPTMQLSLQHLRQLGYLCAVAERWIPNPSGGAQVKQDMFGFIDIVALRDGETLGVQTTSRTNAAARARKIAQHPDLPSVLSAGWRIVVHGWHQPGGYRTKWQLVEFDVEHEVRI